MKQLFSFVFGKLKVIEEQGIHSLYASKKENLEGYRIQVFTGNTSERQKAQSIKASIESDYSVNAYIEYEAPLFKVRVGDFVDKIEAMQLKHRLGKNYPNTYIVKEKNIKLR